MLNTLQKHKQIRTFAIVLNGEFNNLNDTSQFSEDIMEIYT